MITLSPVVDNTPTRIEKAPTALEPKVLPPLKTVVALRERETTAPIRLWMRNAPSKSPSILANQTANGSRLPLSSLLTNHRQNWSSWLTCWLIKVKNSATFLARRSFPSTKCKSRFRDWQVRTPTTANTKRAPASIACTARRAKPSIATVKCTSKRGCSAWRRWASHLSLRSIIHRRSQKKRKNSSRIKTTMIMSLKHRRTAKAKVKNSSRINNSNSTRISNKT